MVENQITRRSIRYYILLFLFSVIFTLAFQGFKDFLLSLVLPIIDIIVLYYYYSEGIKLSEKYFVYSIFFNSLIIRIAAVFIMGKILMAYNGVPYISDNDDYNYQIAAVEILERWKILGFGFYNDIRFSADTYSGFPNFSAALMYLFGTSFWIPRIGNAVLSSFTVVIGYKISKKYSDTSSSRYLGVLLCLLPFTIIFASLQLKDTLLLFFTVLALYSCSNIIENNKIIKSILLLVISFVGISFGRPATIVPIAGGLLIMLINSSLSKGSSHVILKILVFAIVIVLMIQSYGFLSTMGFEAMDDYFDSRYEIMSTVTIQDTKANIRNLSVADYLGAPLYIVGGFFLPPALLIDLGDVINYPVWGVLQHFAFLPFLIPAMYFCFKERKYNPIPFFLLLVYILLRIGMANALFTVFSPRQSLGAIFVMYLMLPMYRPVKKGWQTAIIIISIVVMIVYNLVRLRSHGMF